MDDIVESIQREILEPEAELHSILLKAKLLAHHLKNNHFKRWVKCELDGYTDSKKVPDYRIIHTPLLAYISNGWNGYKNFPISLMDTPDWFQEVADKVYFTPGIKTVEEHASRDSHISFAWSAEHIAIWNHYNPLGGGGHQCYEVRKPVSSSIFAQMLLTVRSRLQDFVLELSDLPWKVTKDSSLNEKIEQLVSVAIYNSVQGGTMTAFDQREQKVQNQNNAAHDININGDFNFGSIQNNDDFVRELKRLKSQLIMAGDAQIIDAELVTDVDYELASAIQEAKKPQPDKNSILEPMERAKNLLSNATGATEFITAIISLIAAGITLL
jgi:hypothetical protein